VARRALRPHVKAHKCTELARHQGGLITEEIGLDDGVTVLQQLGLITTA